MNRAELLIIQLAEIAVLAGELKPQEFNSRVKELRRGGLPSASMGEGRRSSDQKLPGPDKVDRMLKEASTEYAQIVQNVWRSLRRAKSIEDAVCAVAEVSKSPAICANPRCSDELKDRATGECSKCRVHRHRHGAPWPMVPAEK